MSAQATRSLRVFPGPPTLAPGESVELGAWFCSLPPDGDVFGPDGMPGTDDDRCQRARGVRWSTEDQRIARVRPRRGTSVTLTGRRDGVTTLEALYEATSTSTFIARVPVDVAEPIEGTEPDGGDPGAAERPGPGVAVSIVVQPGFAILAPGDRQVFVAYECPLLGVGDPRGADTLPGTGDDFCRPAAEAAWGVLGDPPIGGLDPLAGPYTLLTTFADDGETARLASIGTIATIARTSLTDGSGARSGAVVARVGDQEGGASVAIDPDAEPADDGILGDIDGDGDVDLADIRAVLGAVGSKLGDPRYLDAADLDGNGVVGPIDLLPFQRALDQG